jgi:hypothetical protein
VTAGFACLATGETAEKKEGVPALLGHPSSWHRNQEQVVEDACDAEERASTFS